MNIYTPYTYLIGWSAQNKYYYGAKWAKNCNPKDLWVTYFTSSIHVKQFREQYGEPDVVQVRKCFKTKTEAHEWEAKVLSRIQNKQLFLNRIFGKFTSLPNRYPGDPSSGKGKKRNKYDKSEKMMTHLNDVHQSHPINQIAKTLLKCPHCGKITNLPNAKRHHFDRCKENKSF